jgi:hypothetical protein
VGVCEDGELAGETGVVAVVDAAELEVVRAEVRFIKWGPSLG